MSQVKYEPTIGIECHVQLKTKSKLFARVSNDAREAEPNTTVSAICFGLPGVLPVLNEQAVELAMRAGLALNAKVADFSKFDRKHYFYPDLPKGYQITQFDQPVVGEGYVDILDEGKEVRIGIERAHLEEDAGKLTHPAGADYTLVDLNRAGTPLLEIVSRPDIKSPAAAKAYARELYLLMKYADVSDVDLYHGQMRFDVNISLAPAGSAKLGTRAEIKNLNSFRAVEKAAEYEIKRQSQLLGSGQAVVQETRGWDENKQKTFSQRSKEEAHDYRYFPDADLPPVTISAQRLKQAAKAMPDLPPAIRRQLTDLGWQLAQVDIILDDPPLAASVVSAAVDIDKAHVKRLSNWLVGDIQKLKSQDPSLIDPSELIAKLIKLSELVADGQLSSSAASEVLAVVAYDASAEPEAIAKEKNLIQVSDSGALESIIKQVIAANPQAVQDVADGQERAIGFLVGQVMKESKGQANPQMVQKIIRQTLKL